MCIKIQRKKWNKVIVLGWLFYLNVARHKWRCASGFQLALTLSWSERKGQIEREMQKHRTLFPHHYLLISSQLSALLLTNSDPRPTTRCRGNSFPSTFSPAVLVVPQAAANNDIPHIFPESSDLPTCNNTSRGLVGDFPLDLQFPFWTFFPHHRLQLCKILFL